MPVSHCTHTVFAHSPRDCPAPARTTLCRVLSYAGDYVHTARPLHRRAQLHLCAALLHQHACRQWTDTFSCMAWMCQRKSLRAWRRLCAAAQRVSGGTACCGCARRYRPRLPYTVLAVSRTCHHPSVHAIVVCCADCREYVSAWLAIHSAE